MKNLITILLSFMLIQIAIPVKGTPAFARKYRISCKTCHAPSIPKLKPYGDDFAGNGFKLEDYDSPRYYVETGDDKLSLLRDFPIALRLEGFVNYNRGGDERPDFSAPYLMKLLSGGAVSEKLSYYFYFYMDEHSEVAGVEDAYLMYDNLFDLPLDIMLGQFQVSDPLFKRELRMSLEDYALYTSKIGMSDINLKYDKGVMLTYGLPTGTNLAVEVVNGNGLAEPNASLVFDKDKYKNVLGRVSQSIGDFLRVGGFAYAGKEKITNNADSSILNHNLVTGPDITITLGNLFEINGQYTYRTDSRVFLDPADIVTMEDITTQGILGEIIFTPKGDESDWYALGMFSYVDSDYDPADYKSVTIHFGYLLRRNIRLAGEYTHYLTSSDNEYGSVSFGFVSAF